MRRLRDLASFLIMAVVPALLLISCGGGDGTGPVPASSPATPPTIRNVTISWNPNRETAVNTTGGGYKVYYSSTSGFNITDTGVSVIDVPFVAPPRAPTSVNIDLLSGRYYFRVVAYSALISPWGSGGSTSMPSAQISILVP